jgi:TonB family protein
VPDDIPVEKTVPVTDNPQDVATQNFEEAPAVATPSKIETKKKEVSPEVDEQQRLIEQENNKRIAAENQRKSQEKQNMAGRLFGKGSGNGSEGIAGGEGNQGKLNGVAGAPNYEGGGGKGVGYALSNRSAVDLPRPPKGIQAEGKVVVEILVDRDGNVIDARPGVKGSNTTNEKLYQASKNAAMKAKFNVSANSPERQKGTLTYIFELQ